MNETIDERMNRELREAHEIALKNMTPAKAIEILNAGAEICGDADYLSAEMQLKLVAEWLEEQQKHIDFYRAGCCGIRRSHATGLTSDEDEP